MKLTLKNVVVAAVIGVAVVSAYKYGEKLGISEAVSQRCHALLTTNLYGDKLSDQEWYADRQRRTERASLEAQIEARKNQATNRLIQTKAMRVVIHLGERKHRHNAVEQKYENLTPHGVFSILHRKEHGRTRLTIMSTDGDPQQRIRVGMKVETQSAEKTEWYPAEITKIVELPNKSRLVELKVGFTERAVENVLRTVEELRACKPRKVFGFVDNGRPRITAYVPGAWEHVLDGLQETALAASIATARQEHAAQQAEEAQELAGTKAAWGL